jgi:MoxR-like ATPase
LRHRVALQPEAQMDGVRVDDVLGSILAAVPVPR